MNILLIGGSCSLIDNLILKLRKEGHRVSLITGDRYKQNKYQKVFEEYNFPYDSEDLAEIFESVNADVTIFMGAFDTNFRWKNEEREAVKYISDLTNILVSCSEVKRGKFIFLSSDEVYCGDYSEDIKENQATSGSGVRGATLVQAEEICRNFRENWKMDIVVLRLDHVYGVPRERKEATSICAQMCLSCLSTGQMEADEKHIFSLMPERDAVEYIYQVVRRREHNHSVYHIASGETINELELAQKILEYMDDDVRIKRVSGSVGRCVLSGTVFEDEYGVDTRGRIDDMVKRIAVYMKKHADAFTDDVQIELPWWRVFLNQWMWLIRAVIPFVENLVFFVLFFWLNSWVTESDYFAKLDPYLIYVLLFACVYGQQQATFSALCAVMGYLFGQLDGHTRFEVMLDYNTYIWIAQLFIVGLVVGYMRDQIRSIQSESEELEAHLSRQIADIKDINGSNVRVKDVLEQQLINHKDSIGKIYSITSKLDQTMPDEVMFDAVEMVMELMETKDVAIYNVVNGDYARMFSASSPKARSLGNSIRYREMEGVYQDLKEARVFINKSMDERYPLMANAIYEDDKMKMIVMVWGLGWERMTLGQANFLAVVSYLIQNAVLRSRRYMAALEEKRYRSETNILETSAFRSLVQSYLRAKERNLVECTLLHVRDSKSQYKVIGDTMSKQMRSSDYMGFMEDGEVYVLLANTTHQDASFVQKRFDKNGYTADIVEDLAI